jgi:hypothetical protein
MLCIPNQSHLMSVHYMEGEIAMQHWSPRVPIAVWWASWVVLCSSGHSDACRGLLVSDSWLGDDGVWFGHWFLLKDNSLESSKQVGMVEGSRGDDHHLRAKFYRTPEIVV